MNRADTPPPNCERPTLLARLEATRIGRRWRNWWTKYHDVPIRRGIGKGLRFKAGYNPAYAEGTNERFVQEALAKYLRSGDVFYDIGANIGFLSVIGARLVGPEGHVIAFEPVPENASIVRHNCALNGFSNVRVLEMAIFDKVAICELKITSYSGGASLTTVPIDDLKAVISVPSTTIDALIEAKQALPPTFVKIDVEGAEINVLRGMQNTLLRTRPIVLYELDDNDPEKLAEKSMLCAEFLSLAGYEIHQLQNSYPDINWLVSHYVALPIDAQNV